ncbi:rhamnan synthesis F family protein [Rubritalea tangerina]|uniref:Rhamnan synthesis F family protein n=1 Tax=Rubritalea tangerina TaxID=430798 RepID=A0ABW4ZCB5_9BACT
MNQSGIHYADIKLDESTRELCILASYDRCSQVQKYVYHLIDKVASELDAHVVFVTTSDVLSDEDKGKLSKMGVSVVHRENSGYDFKSYYVGLSCFKDKLLQFERVYHVNDSVYGPFASLSEVKARMLRSGFDAWGMTDSWKINYHVQSYFTCFNSNVFDELVRFWDGYSFESDYGTVISSGEVGLSQHLIKNGFCVGAAFPLEKYVAPYLNKVENAGDNAHTCVRSMSKPRWYSIKQRATQLDPSVIVWRPMLKDGYPFLKTKLLKDWCHLGAHSGDWLNLVPESFVYAQTVAQASVHRDRPALVGKLKPKCYHFFLNPVKYLKYIKNWSEFMRRLISD